MTVWNRLIRETLRSNDDAKSCNMPGPSQHGKFPTLHAFARAKLDAVLTESLPDQWNELIRQIEEREQHEPTRSNPPYSAVHHKKRTND